MSYGEGTNSHQYNTKNAPPALDSPRIRIPDMLPHGLENALANQHLSVVTRGVSTHAELSRGMGPEEQNAPWRPYQGRGRYPAHEKDRVCLPRLSLRKRLAC